MLIYHPMKDPFNCIYRVLCILHDIKTPQIPCDLVKILDFYIVFPHLLKDIELPKSLSKYKPILNRIKAPYENLSDAKQLMFDISIIQNQAINSMVAKGIFVKDDFIAGYLNLRNTYVQKKEIIELVAKAKFRKTEWYKILIEDLSKVPLLGERGLKKRTKLMEYRYDAT